jgi:FixJ family two-component response regulator
MASRKTRIAVVDDDLSVRRALSRLLRAAGFEVETFASGTAFLAAYEAVRPRCIILDLHMQNPTGVELQRQLVRIGSTVPVVIITGHDNPRSRDETKALGAYEYLIKPIDDEELLSAIRGAITSDGSSLLRSRRARKLPDLPEERS